MKRRAVGPLGVVVALGLVAGACGPDGSNPVDVWARCQRGDLIEAVPLTGVLRATRTTPISPPTATDTWQFKIARLAEEGKVVKKGDPVLAFDARELAKSKAAAEAERDAAAKEIARRRADLFITGRDLALQLAEAEANQRKAEMKAEGAAVASGSLDVQIARIDADLARKAARGSRARLDYNQRRTEAELDTLRRRFERAEGRLSDIVTTMARFDVTAPADGTVVHGVGRGDKRKVGDQVWRGETVLEIADLSEMRGKGEVDEIDYARVSLDQRVTVRLDAHPDEEFPGRVARIGDTIQTAQDDSHLRVLRVEVAFDKTDPVRMRPGMRFRGTVESGRAPGVLLLPSEAVFARPDGPVAFVRRGTGFDRRVVEVGRRSATQVEIVRGLEAGDEVALRDLERARAGGGR